MAVAAGNARLGRAAFHAARRLSADRIDWPAFFALYRPLAVRVARGLTSSAERAEELAQEGARALIERASGAGEPFASTAHARNAYLRTVKNLAVTRLRALGRRGPAEGAEDLADPTPPADELLADAEERRRLRESVRAALDGLAPAEGEALRLRYLEGLSFALMAERTGAPISTLHARVAAGLEKIRGRIGRLRPGA